MGTNGVERTRWTACDPETVASAEPNPTGGKALTRYRVARPRGQKRELVEMKTAEAGYYAGPLRRERPEGDPIN